MIYGERIRFRAPSKDDMPFFVAWLNDPEVRQGLALYLPMSMEDEERWFKNMLESAPERHPFDIEVREVDANGHESWQLVGSCGLHEIDWRSRNAELGIMIGNKAYWNRGYGSEAVRLLLRHGFNTLNLHRIWLRVFETNPRAIRSYEKVGFVHEGRKRQAEFIDGKYVDVLVMSVLRPEWDGK